MPPSDPEPDEVASFNPIEWDNSEHEASSEPDAPSKDEPDADGVPFSVHFSSDWEEVTMLNATFSRLPLVALEDRVGV